MKEKEMPELTKNKMSGYRKNNNEFNGIQKSLKSKQGDLRISGLLYIFTVYSRNNNSLIINGGKRNEQIVFTR